MTGFPDYMGPPLSEPDFDFPNHKTLLQRLFSGIFH